MKRLSLFIAIALVLTACSSTQPETQVSPNSQSLDQSTPAAQAALVPVVIEPTAISIPTTSPTNTALPIPSATTAPTQTALPTAIPNSPTPACTNRAEFVRHLSFSDGSVIIQGMYFGKAWRIKNVGTCSWTSDYSLVFVSGEQMNSPAETPLTSEVAPGATVDISVPLFSPMTEGNYSSNWMLRDPSGNLFGTGDLADQPLSANLIVQVKIQVDKFPFPECG
jgi:hypothetical protein